MFLSVEQIRMIAVWCGILDSRPSLEDELHPSPAMKFLDQNIGRVLQPIRSGGDLFKSPINGYAQTAADEN